MKRWLLVLAVLSLVAAACGDAGGDPSTADTNAASATTQAGNVAEGGDDSPATTSAGATDTAGADHTAQTTTTAEPAPEPEGDPAPDFTLALANGDSFSLSAEANPVYLVFWAEW